MDKEIKEILDELNKIDNSFDINDEKLKIIIKNLLMNKPDTQFSEEFKDSLRSHLIREIATNNLLTRTTQSKNIWIIKTFRWLFPVITLSCIWILIFSYYFNLITYFFDKVEHGSLSQNKPISRKEMINDNIQQPVLQEISLKQSEQSANLTEIQDNDTQQPVSQEISLKQPEQSASLTEIQESWEITQNYWIDKSYLWSENQDLWRLAKDDKNEENLNVQHSQYAKWLVQEPQINNWLNIYNLEVLKHSLLKIDKQDDESANNLSRGIATYKEKEEEFKKTVSEDFVINLAYQYITENNIDISQNWSPYISWDILTFPLLIDWYKIYEKNDEILWLKFKFDVLDWEIIAIDQVTFTQISQIDTTYDISIENLDVKDNVIYILDREEIDWSIKFKLVPWYKK